MAEIRLENVVKIYPGSVRAVDGVDLRVRDGEFLVLVGPSGCGKTTMLRTIVGLEYVSAGTISMDGREINDVSPKDRDIAMVFQNHALYPRKTVRQNMAFGLQMRKVSKQEIESRVRDAAETLGLEKLLDRRPTALSGGQQQRVALGRAIVRRPKLFLFDEPLSNLDAKRRIDMRAELARLHRKYRTTTIHVTHDQEEAMTLGDRVAVMRRGRLHQCDTPRNVYRRPRDRFVAGFIGMPTMNFIHGCVRKREGIVFFEGDDEDNFTVPFGPDRLAPTYHQRLDASTGQPGVLGIRPEALRPQDSHAKNAQNAGHIEVTVDRVEILGARMDVFTHTRSGQKLVCRVRAEELQTGSRLTLSIDPNPEGIFLFEPDSCQQGDSTPIVHGRNLTLGD